jgi:hypothetical protein
MNSGVIRDFFRLVTVITSFLSPGDVYCSRSVCYLPQGLSVECLNLQAPTFLGRIFKSPPTSLLYGPEIRRVSRGPSEVLQRRPKTPSPDYAQVLVTKRRKRRPECVAPRARAPVCGSAPANVLYGTLRRPTEGAPALRVAQAVRNARRMISLPQ